MKKFFLLISFAFLYFASIQADFVKAPVVTYTFSGGRFGDNLIAYMHAKWVSYHCGIKLLYKPFPYSEQLVLHTQEEQFTEENQNKYKKIVFLGDGASVNKNRNEKYPVFYILPYFPESAHERKHGISGSGGKWAYYSVNWEDPGFKAELQKLICPRVPLAKIFLPKDCLTVAIHLRIGGVDHTDEVKRAFPLKFPQEQFYMDQLERIYKLFKEYPLYIYLFTDDPQPLFIKERFQKKFQGKKIQFECRTSTNNDKLNVLEDFFSFMQFDCFIHSESNYAVCVSKIHDFIVDIEPKDMKWENGRAVITEVHTKVRPELFPKALKAHLKMP